MVAFGLMVFLMAVGIGLGDWLGEGGPERLAEQRRLRDEAVYGSILRDKEATR